MIPPTPTPIPLGTPIPLELGEVGLWQFAPQAVGLWGQFADYAPGLQWGIIILLGLVLVGLIAVLLRGLTEEEA